MCLAILSKPELTSRRCVPSRTSRTNVTAKSGSIPDVAPAIIEIVPVGAIVVTVAFRIVLYFTRVLFSKFGKFPLFLPISWLALRASSWMNFASLSAKLSACGES